MSDVILEVKDLETCFDTEAGRAQVLDKVSFEIKAGKTVGIVGESGCGKSVTSLSIMRLLPKPAGHIIGGEVLYKGKDITKIPAKDMRDIRGNKLAMIFQEPMTALNPVHKIGKQLGEVYEMHHPEMSKQEMITKSVEMLKAVGIPEPERRLQEFPHQLSGGIRQRVMIAMALSCNPDILIADEPTTALDVTIQAQILKLMKDMQEERGMAIMFITHDLGVIAELCDEVVVMYAGRVAEKGSVRDIFKNPKHAYTKGLLSSIPRLENTSKTQLDIIEGMVPSIFDFPTGCRFANRCPYAEEKCKAERPELVRVGEDHYSSCIKHASLN